ncbi:MAG: type II secretion system F family protein [Polyangiaceae bacterium]
MDLVSWQTGMLRSAADGAVGLGVVSATYIVASAPTREANRLGLRGLKRQRAIARSDGWATTEPLVRWLGVRLSSLVSDDMRAKIDEQIALAGDYMGLTADEYVALCFLSCIGSGAMALILGIIAGFGTAGVLPFAAVGAALPYMQISGARDERLKLISRGLPYVTDLMSLAMGAGLDFPGSIRQVIEKSSNPDDPMIEEFTLILQTLNLGRTRRDALLEFSKRAPVEVVKEFTGAIIQAEERGNPVAETLQIQATVSRNRRSVRAEELAAQAGVKMVGPLMLIFGTIMIMILGPSFKQIGEIGNP